MSKHFIFKPCQVGIKIFKSSQVGKQKERIKNQFILFSTSQVLLLLNDWSFWNKLGAPFLNFSDCVLVRAKCFVTKSSSLFHPICHFIQFHHIINFYFLPSKIRFDFSSISIRLSTSISSQARLDLIPSISIRSTSSQANRIRIGFYQHYWPCAESCRHLFHSSNQI